MIESIAPSLALGESRIPRNLFQGYWDNNNRDRDYHDSQTEMSRKNLKLMRLLQKCLLFLVIIKCYNIMNLSGPVNNFD